MCVCVQYTLRSLSTTIISARAICGEIAALIPPFTIRCFTESKAADNSAVQAASGSSSSFAVSYCSEVTDSSGFGDTTKRKHGSGRGR